MSDDKIKSKLPGISDIPQQPIRTYERDMAEAIAKLNKTNKNKKTSSFIQPVVEPEVKPEIKPGIDTVIYNDKWHRVAPWPNIPPIPTPIPEPTIAPEPTPAPTPVPIPISIPEPTPIEKIIIPTKKIGEKIEEKIENRMEDIRNYEDAIADALAKQKLKREESVGQPLNIPINQTAPIILKPEIPRKMVRTYEDDVANTITREKSSILTMAMAEGTRRGDNSISNLPASQTGKNVLLVILSIVFVVAGVGGGYYLYRQSSRANSLILKQPTKISGLINADIQKTLKLPSLEKDKLIGFLSDNFKNSEVGEGKVTEFILNQEIGSTTKRVTGSQFVNSIKFEITDTLKRSITDKWMIGMYSSGGQTELGPQNLPFIILETDFFQNAFSGMLKWENTMPDEFADIFNYREKVASMNEEIPTIFYASRGIRGIYKDRVIMNRDIREFVSTNGELLLLYTFIDKNTILITTSEAVIPEILNRIEKQTYIR